MSERGALPVPARSSAGAPIAWTLAHSVWMLALTAASWLLADVRLAATGGAASLAVLVMAHTGRWTPDGRFGAANGITTLRIALVVVFAALPRIGPLASLVLLAVLALDGLDGWLARRPPVTASLFGAEFDMETDALLVVVAGLRLAEVGRLGSFIVVPGILRYAYAVALALHPGARGEAPRSSFGRYAFATLATSFVVSAWPVEPIHRSLAAMGAFLVVLSFARSTWWSFRRSERSS